MTDKQIKEVFKNGFYCIEPCPEIKELQAELKAKEQECEELSKGYAELTEIVSPYMDDFTGYNEELGGFDIVLCVKELMEQLEAYKMEAEEGKEINAELKAENEELKEKVENYICSTNCYKYKEAQSYKQALEKVRELIKNDYCFETENCEFCANVGNCINKQILQICDEVNDGQ